MSHMDNTGCHQLNRVLTRNNNVVVKSANPTAKLSLMAPNAVKFMEFMSIIMHTGGPSPRYIPTTPSVRTMFANVFPALRERALKIG